MLWHAFCMSTTVHADKARNVSQQLPSAAIDLRNLAMKTSKGLAVAVLATAAATFSQLAAADPVIYNWDLNLPGTSITDTINHQLNLSGVNYITTTASSPTPGTAYTFNNSGVFNITTYDSSLSLALGGGQLTASLTGATGYGTLGGAFYFNQGNALTNTGILSLYYSPTISYGTTATDFYGTQAGTKIASFVIQGGEAGIVNPNALPTSNGQITATFKANYLKQGVFVTSSGQDLSQLPLLNITYGISTTNGSESYDCSTTNTAPINLSAAFGAPSCGTPPQDFYLSSGGQFKLEAVPEPSSIGMFGLGLITLGFLAMRQKRFRKG